MIRPASLLLLWIAVCSQRLSAGETVDYLRDIKPLLKERCFACHGPLKQKGGLRLDTAAAIRKGGDSGPALVTGSADRSLIVERVSAKNPTERMPPRDEAEPLNATQITLLKTWIDQGAKASAQEKPAEDPRKHWAFQRPTRPELPTVKDNAWKQNPIDAFVAAGHEKLGLQAVPLAAKPTLLRRVYVDLIGLPPTREELHAFLADDSADAYEKVVDRLLASPHYGERWGRHWMDVWRYSDWYGRRAVPDVWNSAPQIWRWRDWIIKSLNDDKGYDRMVQEMLAADEIAPEDDEAAVATGYIVRNWYALNPHQWMRDMVEHTGKAFLGLTFNCAHCHDHKYDPISQEEYFRFRAFFEPLGLRQDRVPGEGDPGPFQKYEYTTLRKVVKLGTVRVYDEKHDAQTHLYLQGDERHRPKDKPPVTPGAPAFLSGDKLRIEPVQLPPTVSYPGLKSFIQQEDSARRTQAVVAAKEALEKVRQEKQPGKTALAEAQLATADAELKSLQARIAAESARHNKAPGNVEELTRSASQAERTAAACSAKEKLLQAEEALRTAQAKMAAAVAGKEKEQAATIVKKTELQLATAKKQLDQAQKNAAVDSTQYTPLSPVYPTTSTGRRRALAQWIAGRDNPLTARVAVNHIWMRHFERPLVETVFDFGLNGKRPTHPELLDWLAVEFMESGWSMKKLHRLIVTSRTYRLQSAAGSEHSTNVAKDADNRFLWRYNPRRMEAEIIRDSILHTAGELDRRLGGPVLETSEESTSRRRSLYFTTYPEDGGHLKFLDIFDAPDPCDCYRRTESVVPQQALALTNNQLALQQSRLLTRKLWVAITAAKRDGHDSAFVAAAFEQLLCRAPLREEEAMCRDFLRKQTELFRNTDPKQLAAGGTGVAPSPDPEMRARESLVRALFSHGDFVTIR